VWPGAVGLVIGGPIGLAACATVGDIIAYEFERKMWKHVQETVKNASQVRPTLESPDTYTTKDYEIHGDDLFFVG
jgi:hypothetical protein